MEFSSGKRKRPLQNGGLHTHPNNNRPSFNKPARISLELADSTINNLIRDDSERLFASAEAGSELVDIRTVLERPRMERIQLDGGQAGQIILNREIEK